MLNPESERWAIIPSFDSYEASTLGAVRRVGSSQQLSQILNRGYLQVILYHKCARRCSRVHSLVLEAFVGPRLAGSEVNHRNGLKADNRLANLEYCTRSDNMLHCYRTGLHHGTAGERNPHARLTQSQVDALRARRSAGEKLRLIAADFGITESAVSKISSKQRWKGA